MKKDGNTIIFDNLLDWAPASAFTSQTERTPGKWIVFRGMYGSISGALLGSRVDEAVPELTFDPGLTGWHDVRIRVFHGRGKDGYGTNPSSFSGSIYAGTSKDRALRVLRAPTHAEEFEDLSLGPRDLTGATIRLDGSYLDTYIDSVRFVPCDRPSALPPAEKEVCGINDFADTPDDYRPNDHCAAESVRVHAEAGFTTIFWKSFAVRCEFQTKIGDLRSKDLQPHLRVNLGHLLEKYDTLEAAAAEAAKYRVKILGWMRINNEFSARTGSGTEWTKFSKSTRFHEAHPDLCEREKDGRLTNRLSFAYPEVREYLCSLGREILDKGMGGLMIDVLRHPPMAKYDKPLVDSFIEKTGQNPMEMEGSGTEEWLRHKCTAFTDLLRDFRQMMDGSGHKDKPIYVRAMPQPWRLLRDGCDVDAWMREGIVDTYVAGHHCITSPGHPVYYDLAPIQGLIKGRARLVAQVFRFGELHTALALAQQAYDQGADGSAIYESDHVITMPAYRDALHKLRSAKING